MKYSKILLCFGALWASSAFPAPAPCDTLRVAFLTDIHVTPGNVQDSLFRVAVDEINASPCDIVIFGGDLTNLGSDAELEYVHGLISRLEKPWHAVPGNHETTWSESACTAFARIFGHDGRTAFRAGDYLFLGYASGPFMKMAMGAVRTEDLAWLAAEAAKARPGQRIVSLCHYPLNNDLTNRTEVTATLRRLGIPLTLFGHYHRAPSLFNFDSIAGIQGRALRGKSDSDAGYTLLDFWASWCPDCRKDAPNIIALYEKFHKKGVEFLGVSFDRNQESWKKGVEALGLPYTQVSDLKNMRESDVAQAYRISWIPTVYVIDPQGNVALATVMSEKVAAYLTSVFPDCE